MRELIQLSILVLILSACSDNSQNLKHEAKKVEKDYLEEYYELEEVRYENYLKTMAG